MRLVSLINHLKRPLQSLCMQHTLHGMTCQCSVSRKMLPPTSFPLTFGERNLSTEQARFKTLGSAKDAGDSFGMKIAKTIGWLGGFYSEKAVVSRAAQNIYECCADGMDYREFKKLCRMPDTFQSWFLVLQLHVWMCLVRLKQDGRKGRIAYRTLVHVMWQDVEERMRSLGVDDPSQRKESLASLVQEFYGLIIAYDEGLVSEDRVLASALWRNMMQDKKDTDLLSVAALTRHVRKQIQALDSLSSEELLVNGRIEWLPLETHYS